MKKLNRIFFTLTILWMIVIFIFSSQSGDTSANLSGGITEAIVSTIIPNYDSYSPDKQLHILENTNFIIRKAAHFTEYAILGIFSCLTLLTYACNKNILYKTDNIKKIMFNIIFASLIFSALYAISDEIHQGFSKNRSPAIADVLLDSSGALFGILPTTLFFYIVHIKNKLNNYTKI